MNATQMFSDSIELASAPQLLSDQMWQVKFQCINMLSEAADKQGNIL